MSRGTHAAVVLAGDRGADDPIARTTGAACKALSPVAGKPLLSRVLTTLRAAPAIETIIVVGPDQATIADQPALAALLAGDDVRWIAPSASPAASAARGLAALGDRPALLTTADHALLTPAMIDELLAGPACDLAVGLASYAGVRAAFPDSRRTAIRLAPGPGYCGCNLFAVHTAAARAVIEDWQRVERERKHPARVIAGMLGWRAIAAYLLRRLTLEQAFARLSRRTGLNIRPVILSYPQAAVDVDTPADLALVEAILRERESDEPTARDIA
ncbi:NTP transferase domain-containing protein [Salinisphaera sp. T31B1]|uniref:NTP transferase domain-containing protein n=1 Tax=Salinisphaera sp. T31B1 TaxID=727963 RepID=UPI0033407E5C